MNFNKKNQKKKLKLKQRKIMIIRIYPIIKKMIQIKKIILMILKLISEKNKKLFFKKNYYCKVCFFTIFQFN